MAPWTSRKRVETALRHETPDRVPIDFAITLNAYVSLRERLGLPVEQTVQADRFFEVRPALDLIEALGVDMTFVRLRKPKNVTPPAPLADGTQLDEWGVGRKLVDLPGGAKLFEVTYSPWKDLHPDDIDLDAYPCHEEPFPDAYAVQRIGLGAYYQAFCGTGGRPAGQGDLRREQGMTWHLQQLARRHERILGREHTGMALRVPKGEVPPTR